MQPPRRLRGCSGGAARTRRRGPRASRTERRALRPLPPGTGQPAAPHTGSRSAHADSPRGTPSRNHLPEAATPRGVPGTARGPFGRARRVGIAASTDTTEIAAKKRRGDRNELCALRPGLPGVRTTRRHRGPPRRESPPALPEPFPPAATATATASGGRPLLLRIQYLGRNVFRRPRSGRPRQRLAIHHAPGPESPVRQEESARALAGVVVQPVTSAGRVVGEAGGRQLVPGAVARSHPLGTKLALAPELPVAADEILVE